MFGVSDGEVASSPEDASIRPPDLAPAQVRDHDDVLAGWDRGADATEIAGWNRDQAPFPTDTVVVAATAVLGGLVGAAVAPARVRGAVAGIGVGAVVGAAARQVWRLTD